MAIITEDILEQQAIEWFKEIGYEYKHGNDIRSVFHGANPEELSKRPEFTILIHFLKSIIDGELNIPNELTDTIRNKSEELGINLEDIKKRLH